MIDKPPVLKSSMDGDKVHYPDLEEQRDDTFQKTLEGVVKWLDTMELKGKINQLNPWKDAPYSPYYGQCERYANQIIQTIKQALQEEVEK